MSYKQGDEIHIEDDAASGGSKEGVVRWVLLISIVLAIVILSVIWMTGALTQDETESEVNVTNREAQMDDGDSTDSIIMEEGQDDLEGQGTKMEDGVSVIENE